MNQYNQVPLLIIYVSCFLSSPQPPPIWMNTAMGAFNASELTPSESLVTSDDEEIKVGDHRA